MSCVSAVNKYPKEWFSSFPAPPDFTAAQIAFLASCLKEVDGARVLDIGCGSGRHAHGLARLGYDILGIDTSEHALRLAQRSAPAGAVFKHYDMREVGALVGEFDAILSMWQSFGYFDDRTNQSMMADWFAKLAPQGVLVLDIYNAEYWRRVCGDIAWTQAGNARMSSARAIYRIDGNRLRCKIKGGGVESSFDWQVFTPYEMIDLLSSVGLEVGLVCSGFDPGQAASVEHKDMQFVCFKK